MQPNHTGRVTLILIVLLGCLLTIFPPNRWFNPDYPGSQKINLKPGIDMVGGTSLLYDIKAPPGYAGNNISEQVMNSLKKRVDPNGVRNLVWRPQGNQLEIQMPLSGASEKGAEVRKTYAEAQRALDATNLRIGEVIAAIEGLTGDARRDRINQLAAGSEERSKLLGSMASTYDQIQAARKSGDFATRAAKEDEYNELRQKLEATNLTINDLESILNINDAKLRAEKLNEKKNAAKDFAARATAINNFETAFVEYSKIKGQIDDSADLKRMLKGSGVLEFHILVTDWNNPIVAKMVDRLHKKGPVVEAEDQMRWYQVDRPEELHQRTEIFNDKHWALAWTTPDKQMVNGPGIDRWELESARPGRDEIGLSTVEFTFDQVGARYFGELTGKNRGQTLSIMLDEKVINAATINATITRHGQISGGPNGYSQSELMYLVNTLNAGSMPARLAEDPVRERTVGPQLGADNLRKGFIGCVLGITIVAIFLFIYYHVSGLVAIVALLLNVLMILGVLAMFQTTFTLPGLAGIVLTIGAAVDANVLIFERYREEQHRGLNVRLAIHNAYDRAFSAIVDSNATTLVTSLILYWLGSEEVKGFGLTLLVGLLASLFTSLYVTRTIFDIMIDKFGLTKLGSLPNSFPAWDRFLRPNVDWMKLAPYFCGLSALILILGGISFVRQYNAGKMFDIEFASGTSVQVELKQPMEIDEVRKIVESGDDQFLPAPGVQAVSTNKKDYEVVTPNDKSSEVRDELLKLFGDKLKMDVKSTFTNTQEPADKIVGTTILPIDSPTMKVAGLAPDQIATHVNGAAIILDKLTPALKPSEVKDRIERQRLKPQANGQPYPYRDFSVSGVNQDEPSSTIVVLVSDAALGHDKDPAKWLQELVTPMWRLVNDAVNSDAQLQKVATFGPQVASTIRRDAFAATVLSLIVVVAYIWLRFGNLRYGTATMVAMIHDTLLVIGAVGLSHFIAGTFIGDLLLVEPFRINLTLVAAILTVMSYSMIDTIVVFDRVRENRGKYGHLSRKIVNDSINQTLSRTLLTVGSTMLTIAGMYFFGGSSVHGFTFVLLIGILVGSYSSIAVACPILLMGVRKEEAEAKKTPARTVPAAG